jgi:tRNA threonylcarbamoyladenosine biosynthesis protein TsaB
MTLYIDTTDRYELIVRLEAVDSSVIAEERYAQGTNHAQHLLPIIDRLLAEKDHSLSELRAITVNVGPGSFTGTRVGVAAANALGWALGLPVNGQAEGVARPVYDRAPNISSSAK